MGLSSQYQNVKEWTFKDTGYQKGDMVKYKGNIFIADYWAQAAPGEKPKPAEGWRLYDELYDITSGGLSRQSSNVIAYLPTWRKSEGFAYGSPQTYQYLTHVIVSFLMFNVNILGQLDQQSVKDVKAVLPDVFQGARAQGVSVMVALGGATDYGFLNLMTAIGSNENNPLLRAAVNAVVSFVNENNLDGVDLDMECWWDRNGDASKDQGGRMRKDGPHPAGLALTLFAKKLRERFGQSKIISAALPGTSWYGNNYDPRIVTYLDWAGLMTYDLTGSWKTSPVGPHSALYIIRDQKVYANEQHGAWPGGGMDNNPILSAEDAIWYWTNPFYSNWQGEGAKVDRSKLVIGAAAYGYDFAYANPPNGSGQPSTSYKAVSYKEVMQEFFSAPRFGLWNVKMPGQTPHPAFLQLGGTYPFSHNIYLEGTSSVAEKMKFSKRINCRGVMLWELTQDTGDAVSLAKALYENSGNVVNTVSHSSGQANRWMTDMAFNTLISDLKIPGTHDSAARDTNMFAKCQDLSIFEQLEKGIRYLDVRLGPCEGVVALCAYHGAAYLKLNADDIFNAVYAFLNRNPKEAIFMRIKNERGSLITNYALYQQVLNYVNKQSRYWWKATDLTPKPQYLGDIRGKILALMDVGDAFDGKVGINYGNILVKDEYAFSTLAEGLTALGPHLVASPDFVPSSDHLLYHSQASGYTTPAPNPGTFAEMFNLRLQILLNEFSALNNFPKYPQADIDVDHEIEMPKSWSFSNIPSVQRNPMYPLVKSIRSRSGSANKLPKGIISMDFPSQDLIDSIIRFNFP